MTAEGLKTFCGTPQYFAPEVLRRSHTVKGNGRYGKEIDCWSIGVILFILLSGSPPFDVSAGFDAVANAKIIFYEDQWKHVSRDARDLVMRLLEKDPRRRMSVRDACRHAWVLVEDGDTHCHPLHDPLVGRKDDTGSDEAVNNDVVDASSSSNTVATKMESDSANGDGQKNNTATSAATSTHNNVNDEHTQNTPSDALSKPSPKPPSSPWRKICAPVDANALSPTARNNNRKTSNNQRKFQSMSAPQLSKDERQPSIWPANRNDKIVTKAIQQACQDSQPSPTRSPIHKKQLFNGQACTSAAMGTTAANIDSGPKKMTKQDVESIKSAGNTLPTPVINKESHLIKKVSAPKKKVQSTLFSSADTTKQPAKASNQSTNSALTQVPEKDNPSKKRKAMAVGTKTGDKTPSITPPGTESNNNVGLVFRLNKKHKVGGKSISPEDRQYATTSATATAAAPEKKKKSELSDDELQDFSDDDDDDEGTSLPARVSNSPTKTDKKPLEKYLQKRKMDSIESSASIDIDNNKRKPHGIQQHLHQRRKNEEEPRPVSKSSVEGNLQSESQDAKMNTNNNNSGKGKDRKLVQSFLFGKPPPNNNSGVDSLEASLPETSPTSNDLPQAADDDDPSCKMQVDGGAELERQASVGSNGSGTTSAPKGKQRSIKSWFQPKK